MSGSLSDWESVSSRVSMAFPGGYNGTFGAYHPETGDAFDWLPMTGYPRMGMAYPELFHVSPRANRESIQAKGLIGHEDVGATSSPWAQDVGQPHGNYFFDNEQDAREYVAILHGQVHPTDPHPGDGDIDTEDRYHWPEEPEDWNEEENGPWEEHADSDATAATEDPQGYDIHRVHALGLPVYQDPEPRLEALRRGEEVPETHERARELSQPQDPDDEWATYDGSSSPIRYHVPAHVEPNRIQLHQHVPRWDLTEQSFHDMLEDEDYNRRQVPNPMHAVPYETPEAYQQAIQKFHEGAVDWEPVRNAPPPSSTLSRVAGDYDYRMHHQAPGSEESAPMHDLSQIVPEDIYTKPHFYTRISPDQPWNLESWRAAKKVRGKPEAMVPIYRATPAGVINPGDWVTPSEAYARQHAKHYEDPALDMPVVSKVVPASHLHWDANDINEYGYNPPQESGAPVERQASGEQEPEPTCSTCQGDGVVGESMLDCPDCSATGTRPWLYHMAPASARASIGSQGLRPALPSASGRWPDNESVRAQPHGVYLTEDPESIQEAMGAGMDTWRVHPYGVREPQQDGAWGDTYTQHPVEPRWLRREGGAHVARHEKVPIRTRNGHERLGARLRA